jgi:hypothetical protein
VSRLDIGRPVRATAGDQAGDEQGEADREDEAEDEADARVEVADGADRQRAARVGVAEHHVREQHRPDQRQGLVEQHQRQPTAGERAAAPRQPSPGRDQNQPDDQHREDRQGQDQAAEQRNQWTHGPNLAGGYDIPVSPTWP